MKSIVLETDPDNKTRPVKVSHPIILPMNHPVKIVGKIILKEDAPAKGYNVPVGTLREFPGEYRYYQLQSYTINKHELDKEDLATCKSISVDKLDFANVVPKYAQLDENITQSLQSIMSGEAENNGENKA